MLRYIATVPVTHSHSSMPTPLSPHARNVALVVAAALFMQFLDGVIIVTALPRMARDFGVETLEMSLGVTIYMLAVAICIPAAAWLSDRFGARRVFLAALAVFTLTSVACGMAQDLGQFAIARALQGAGSSVLFPVGRIIVLRTAAKSEIVPAIGLTIWPALFAPVIGPALGGFITEYISWHWNFWINIPLGIIGLVLVAMIVPRDAELKHRPFDAPGFLLTGVTLGCLLYGFDALVQGTLPSWLAAVLIVLGFVVGAAAVTWLLRIEHPLIDLRTLRIATFAATDARAGAILRTAINATPFLLPLMFQVAYGMDALSSGALVVIYFLGNLVIKAITTPALRRFGFRSVLTINGVLAGVSVAACGLLGPQTPYLLTALVLFIAGATRSMQFTALATLAFADVDADRRSSATTISSMSQQLSMVFGVAVAAGTLNLSQMWRGAPVLGVIDFQITYIVMGVIIIACALQLLTLERNAGAEVSGHRRPQAA
ncbi:DHA2 family efflux MFS transporter permease subunit [Devosia sp.]|uniref:DHA2 family efflux MFS transporter permease subunit n=1 Tax=Devosia sp. TaxID=1871048 RepID=UPI003442E13A